MRESVFIERNRKKWKDCEKLLRSDDHDPEKLKKLYIELTDDLSYSRTFFERRSISIYLNNLTQQLFHKIFKRHSGKSAGLLYFWREELPAIVYNCRHSFFLSLVIFVIAFAMGIISSINDPQFSKMILGESYVAMTEENIEGGDPMAVYKQRGETSMFLSITWNNLRVSFMAFAFGLIFCVGTIGILLTNGIMVGTFQYFFVEKDLLRESFLTIWMHGTLEISCIIIAGAAGITMGKGLLFPGTYPRLQALQVSAGKGLKIMIAIVPLFIFAAFIEGFFTRYTEVGDTLRLLFITTSLIFICGYFILLPWLKSRRGFVHQVDKLKPGSFGNKAIDLSEIKTSGEICSDLFSIYRASFSKIFPNMLLTAILMAIIFTVSKEDNENGINLSNGSLNFMISFLQQLSSQFNYRQNPFMYPINSIGFAFLSMLTFVACQKILSNSTLQYKSTPWQNKLPVVVVTALALNLLFFAHGGLTLILLIVAAPFILMGMSSALLETPTPRNIPLKTLFLLAEGGYFFLLTYISLLLIALVVMLITISPLSYFLLEFLQWNLVADIELYNFILTLLISFCIYITLALILPVFVIGFCLIYLNLLEIKDAGSLKIKISNIGDNLSSKYDE